MAKKKKRKKTKKVKRGKSKKAVRSKKKTRKVKKTRKPKSRKAKKRRIEETQTKLFYILIQNTKELDHTRYQEQLEDVYIKYDKWLSKVLALNPAKRPNAAQTASSFKQICEKKYFEDGLTLNELTPKMTRNGRVRHFGSRSAVKIEISLTAIMITCRKYFKSS